MELNWPACRLKLPSSADEEVAPDQWPLGSAPLRCRPMATARLEARPTSPLDRNLAAATLKGAAGSDARRAVPSSAGGGISLPPLLPDLPPKPKPLAVLTDGSLEGGSGDSSSSADAARAASAAALGAGFWRMDRSDLSGTSARFTCLFRRRSLCWASLSRQFLRSPSKASRRWNPQHC